ncbi:MAG: helix-turn-helix transcriptional regulator [Candidatus Korobacteraceae bacterium]
MYPNLKLHIFRLGIRQNQIAKDLKLCESQLSKIIHGYRDPSAGERKLLADYLKVDESWLFERHENVLTPQSALFTGLRGDKNGSG